ncbi:MAG: hypothetical protein ACOCZB_03640 [Spirochaetota bacterium]
MKKVALVLLLAFAASMVGVAQETADEPDLYVTTLYIEKVYATTLGYRIDYRRQSSLMLATSYLPLEWFGGPGSPARIVYADRDGAVPFISIFWENSEISHVVLYVPREASDLAWGSLTMTDALRERFNVDSPQFTF